MSLCLILMSPDQLIMAGDSRACRTIDGIKYAVDDNVRKLHVVDNKAIFFGGLQVTGEKIISEVSKIKNASIDDILSISKRVIEKFKENDPNYIANVGDTRLTDFTVGMWENEKPVVYNFSDYDNFELKRFEAKNHLQIMTVGSHQKQAEEMAKKLCSEMDVIPLYKFIYSNLASEEMGGTLYMYITDRRFDILDQHITKIKDLRDIRRKDIANIYNHCMITQAHGVQVFDASGNERIQIGNYTPGKYGMVIRNAYNKVVLDEDGILQTDTIQEADNVASGYPLKLRIYVDDDVIRIDKVRLAFSLEAFRSYETQAANNETQTSEASSVATSESNGDHYHEVFQYMGTVNQTTYENTQAYEFRMGNGSGGNGTNFFLKSPGGQTVLYTKGSSGTHSHGMNHTHTVGAHTHPITRGIFTDTQAVASGVKVYVDGVLCLDNGGAGYNTDRSDLYLTLWITTKGWHTVELTSLTLGRINASLYVKSFVGSN